MPKYYVSVRVPFVLETVVEAKSEEELEEKLENLEPEDFENFHNFYEWLGSNWNQIKDRIEVEKIEESEDEEPEILDYEIVGHEEHKDYVRGETTYYLKIVKGRVKYKGKEGTFKYEVEREGHFVAEGCTIDGDSFTEEEKEVIKDWITNNAYRLFK